MLRVVAACVLLLLLPTWSGCLALTAEPELRGPRVGDTVTYEAVGISRFSFTATLERPRVVVDARLQPLRASIVTFTGDTGHEGARERFEEWVDPQTGLLVAHFRGCVDKEDATCKPTAFPVVEGLPAALGVAPLWSRWDPPSSVVDLRWHHRDEALTTRYAVSEVAAPPGVEGPCLQYRRMPDEPGAPGRIGERKFAFSELPLALVRCASRSWPVKVETSAATLQMTDYVPGVGPTWWGPANGISTEPRLARARMVDGVPPEGPTTDFFPVHEGVAWARENDPLTKAFVAAYPDVTLRRGAVEGSGHSGLNRNAEIKIYLQGNAGKQCHHVAVEKTWRQLLPETPGVKAYRITTSQPCDAGAWVDPAEVRKGTHVVVASAEAWVSEATGLNYSFKTINAHHPLERETGGWHPGGDRFYYNLWLEDDPGAFLTFPPGAIMDSRTGKLEFVKLPEEVWTNLLKRAEAALAQPGI